MFENLSEAMKQEVHERYINACMYVDVRGFTEEQKNYLAVRYGQYDPIKEQMTFDILTEMVKGIPSIIVEILPFCKTKQQQQELVNICINNRFQADSYFLEYHYPFLLNNYLENHLAFENKEQDKRVFEKKVVFKNDMGIIFTLATRDYNDLKKYVSQNQDTNEVYNDAKIAPRLVQQTIEN